MSVPLSELDPHTHPLPPIFNYTAVKVEKGDFQFLEMCVLHVSILNKLQKVNKNLPQSHVFRHSGILGRQKSAKKVNKT